MSRRIRGAVGVTALRASTRGRGSRTRIPYWRSTVRIPRRFGGTRSLRTRTRYRLSLIWALSTWSTKCGSGSCRVRIWKAEACWSLTSSCATRRDAAQGRRIGGGHGRVRGGSGFQPVQRFNAFGEGVWRMRFSARPGLCTVRGTENSTESGGQPVAGLGRGGICRVEKKRPVPEPASSLALIAAGLGLWNRSRRASRPAPVDHPSSAAADGGGV